MLLLLRLLQGLLHLGLHLLSWVLWMVAQMWLQDTLATRMWLWLWLWLWLLLLLLVRLLLLRLLLPPLLQHTA